MFRKLMSNLSTISERSERSERSELDERSETGEVFSSSFEEEEEQTILIGQSAASFARAIVSFILKKSFCKNLF